jgi:hypothetical protein
MDIAMDWAAIAMPSIKALAMLVLPALIILPDGTTIDWTKWHTIGQLWVSGAQNGGTGYMQDYFDGVPAYSVGGQGPFGTNTKIQWTDPATLPLNISTLESTSGACPCSPNIWSVWTWVGHYFRVCTESAVLYCVCSRLAEIMIDIQNRRLIIIAISCFAFAFGAIEYVNGRGG